MNFKRKPEIPSSKIPDPHIYQTIRDFADVQTFKKSISIWGMDESVNIVTLSRTDLLQVMENSAKIWREIIYRPKNY